MNEKLSKKSHLSIFSSYFDDCKQNKQKGSTEMSANPTCGSPCVYFTNVLQAAFTQAQKKTDNLTILFVL